MDDRPALFVYGTLRPGEERWPMLEPYVVDHGWDDAVPGRLYDTGLGYPAAVFDRADTGRDAGTGDGVGDVVGDGNGVVLGRTFPLLTAASERALAVLDEEEGTVEGLYRRILVTTVRGTRAWAYEYGTGLELTPIRSGDWRARTP